jgi:hypothetical protein
MQINTLEVSGIKPAFKGMRNPMNSWDKSDSYPIIGYFKREDDYYPDYECGFIIGEKDLQLAKSLIKAGSEHSKFLRQIQVWVDFDMPRYWWSEFDTYHYNTKNSCSTMHKLLNKQTPIELYMFEYCAEDKELLLIIIDKLNEIREQYINTDNQKTKDYLLLRAKRLLPEGFLQLRTVNTNYAELRNIYHQREHHRLKDEWVDTFCKWVESLPYAKELIII